MRANKAKLNTKNLHKTDKNFKFQYQISFTFAKTNSNKKKTKKLDLVLYSNKRV